MEAAGSCASGAASLGALTVRGSGPEGADAAIARAVGEARAPSEMTVVTADRELSRRVRDAGGKVCAPAEFFRRFGKAGQTAAPAPGRVDVEEWMEWFEDEKNRGR